MIQLNMQLVMQLESINIKIQSKKSCSRFTEEVFKVKEVHETKPYTYLLEDLNGEKIKKSFHSFALISVTN